ncbi:MAG TPA: MFS transporter, partial [Hyphomicrobiaceae bacterium]
FPPQRVALANGVYIMLGALGALSATGPAEAVVQALGWRGLFAALAVASAAVALLILLVVPERKPAIPAAGAPRIGLLAIYLDPRFLRIAPLAGLGVGTSFSLQGLWAAPWLTDVAGLDRSAVVGHLTVMAAALAASALLLGAVAERLRRAGIPTELFLAGTLILSMAAQLALSLGVPVPSHLLFAIVAAGGATTVLSFAVLAQYFPKEASGRANAALGVLNMGTAFGLQCLSGFIVALWPADAGRYPAEAHQAAMAAGLALRIVALVVFIAPRRRPRVAPMALAVTRAFGYDMAVSASAHTAVVTAWTQHVRLFRTYAAGWRLAACAGAAVRCPLGSLVHSRRSCSGCAVCGRHRRSGEAARCRLAIQADRADPPSRCAGGGVLRAVLVGARASADRWPHSRTSHGIRARYRCVHCRMGRDSSRAHSDGDRFRLASHPHNAHGDPRRRRSPHRRSKPPRLVPPRPLRGAAFRHIMLCP